MIEKYKQIVNLLLQLTSDRRQSWEKTSGNEYKTNIGKNYISIRYHEASNFAIISNSKSDSTSIDLLLWNEAGEVIDEINAEKGTSDFSSLFVLYEEARRSYGQVYDRLDEIIVDLNAKMG